MSTVHSLREQATNNPMYTPDPDDDPYSRCGGCDEYLHEEQSTGDEASNGAPLCGTCGQGGNRPHRHPTWATWVCGDCHTTTLTVLDASDTGTDYICSTCGGAWTHTVWGNTIDTWARVGF